MRKLGWICEPICAHSISLMAPMKCGVALMSLSSETESIVCPTLYQRAALRRSSFSASVAGAIMLYLASDLVLKVFALYCGVARRVGCFGVRSVKSRGFSRPESRAFPSCLPSSHFTTTSKPPNTQCHDLFATFFQMTYTSAITYRNLGSPIIVTTDRRLSACATPGLNKTFASKMNSNTAKA